MLLAGGVTDALAVLCPCMKSLIISGVIGRGVPIVLCCLLKAISLLFRELHPGMPEFNGEQDTERETLEAGIAVETLKLRRVAGILTVTQLT